MLFFAIAYSETIRIIPDLVRKCPNLVRNYIYCNAAPDFDQVPAQIMLPLCLETFVRMQQNSAVLKFVFNCNKWGHCHGRRGTSALLLRGTQRAGNVTVICSHESC